MDAIIFGNDSKFNLSSIKESLHLAFGRLVMTCRTFLFCQPGYHTTILKASPYQLQLFVQYKQDMSSRVEQKRQLDFTKPLFHQIASKTVPQHVKTLQQILNTGSNTSLNKIWIRLDQITDCITIDHKKKSFGKIKKSNCL